LAFVVSQTFGETKDHDRSFYCTHISGVQRVANGNTLITMGPQGIMFEVTPEGEEVWRYINPVCSMPALGFTLIRIDPPLNAPAIAHQRLQVVVQLFDYGINLCHSQVNHRGEGRFSLFRGMRYAPTYAGLAGRDLTPKGTLEATF
jgi:hypothetical protein